MKNLCFTFISFYIFKSILLAQTPEVQWTKIISLENGFCNEVRQTLDGGYILAANNLSSGHDHFDWWLIKTDNMGEIVWDEVLSITGECSSVEIFQDTMYVFTGYDSGDGEVYLILTDSYGNHLIDSTYEEEGWWSSVLKTEDNGFITTGEAGWPVENLSLVKFNDEVNIEWSKTYGSGEAYERGEEIKHTSDGGYIIIGDISSSTYWYKWLLKTNSFGDTVWTKLLSPNANSVVQTTDDGFLIAGNTDEGNNIQLLKTNEIGDTLWTKEIGDTSSSTSADIVRMTNDDNYIIAGSIDGDAYTVKVNIDGDIIWEKRVDLGLWEEVVDIQQTSDGGYILVGGKMRGRMYVYGDIWLIKLSSDLTDVRKVDLSLTNYNLEQNYPNPFNPNTKIKYSILQASKVTIKVYDVLGNEIATLVNEEKLAGSYEAEFNAGEITNRVSAIGGYASGVYFYQLRAGSFVGTKKMVLLH